MTIRTSRYAGGWRAAVLLSGVLLAGCGDSTTSPTPIVLADTTLTLVAGVTCATGNVVAEFNGTAGKSVTILATGANTLTPQFTLYAPDFTTQLAGATSNRPGNASLVITLGQTGLHHVSLCDANAVGGALRVTVTQS